jgi:hypothetical protein
MFEWREKRHQGGFMKLNRVVSFAAPALLSAAMFFPAVLRAGQTSGLPEISKLLADTKAEAVELKADAADLDSFVRSNLSWMTHAKKIDLIKEHVNNTGKLLAKLKEAESLGSPWQQTAIARIEPLLRELAANTETVIQRLNENSAKIHFPEYRACVKTHYELASDLEALIRDFVSYGETKEKLDRLQRKLEVTD